MRPGEREHKNKTESPPLDSNKVVTSKLRHSYSISSHTDSYSPLNIGKNHNVITNIVISYQCLSPRILSPLTIVDVEVDALRCDEPSDQLDGESAMFPDPVGRQDDGTAEGALARLHGAFTIHCGWVHAQLKCLATLRMAIHVV